MTTGCGRTAHKFALVWAASATTCIQLYPQGPVRGTGQHGIKLEDATVFSFGGRLTAPILPAEMNADTARVAAVEEYGAYGRVFCKAELATAKSCSKF